MHVFICVAAEILTRGACNGRLVAAGDRERVCMELVCVPVLPGHSLAKSQHGRFCRFPLPAIPAAASAASSTTRNSLHHSTACMYTMHTAARALGLVLARLASSESVLLSILTKPRCSK